MSQALKQNVILLLTAKFPKIDNDAFLLHLFFPFWIILRFKIRHAEEVFIFISLRRIIVVATKF
jgi:hypothetical protein